MNDSFLLDSRYVYSKLEDDISKNVFLMQLLNNATGDIRFVTGMNAKYRNLSSDIEIFYEKIHKANKIYIYGAGVNGKAMVKYFPEIKWEAFIDKYRKEKIDSETKLPILSIESFVENNKNCINDISILISVINKSQQMEIYKELIDRYGICKNNIIFCVNDWRNNSSQYFDLFSPKEHEVFVDCGCYDGGTCYRFLGWCGNKGYDYIYGFEADKTSYHNSKKNLERINNCTILPFGTSKENGKMYFYSNEKEDAHIISSEEAKKTDSDCIEEIDVVSLDNYLKDKRVTFIKMDIEGAEWDTLLGAEEIIRQNRPRLAISVYHKMGDFIRIPEYLLSIHSDYKIYFRQYSLINNETIMYAE